MSSNNFAKGLKRSALTVALGLCFAGGVHAQSTTGDVYGSAPAGSTVTITNNSGLTRTVTADANGRYSANNLPVGNYVVTAGGVRREVTVTLGGGTNVSFGGDSTTTLGTVTVTAASAPVIDVTSVTTSTIITSEELARLPIARSAEAIALLSPGAVTGNGTFFGNQIAFGGSSVGENAYYLNGYFSGNPITNVGGFTLPYGSIEQQQTYTGGYGAKYGRSAGGVISQVGKSGSNDWHFGGQVVFEPRGLKEERPDRFFPNFTFADPRYSYTDPSLAGTSYDSGKDRLNWGNTYSAYASGPILRDRLFFFVSAEDNRRDFVSPGGNPNAGFSHTGTRQETRDPKLYAKLNWNITDNHLLEYTYVAEKFKQSGTQYEFDYPTYAFGAALNPTTALIDNTEFSILRYTGYLTDSLTLTANYGRSRNRYDETPFLTG
ncbi:MAG: TonB-dependent receptor, partial [Thermomonas sp.]